MRDLNELFYESLNEAQKKTVDDKVEEILSKGPKDLFEIDQLKDTIAKSLFKLLKG